MSYNTVFFLHPLVATTLINTVNGKCGKSMGLIKRFNPVLIIMWNVCHMYPCSILWQKCWHYYHKNASGSAGKNWSALNGPLFHWIGFLESTYYEYLASLFCLSFPLTTAQTK